MAVNPAEPSRQHANPALELETLGQSVWYDNISRELLHNGEIKRLIDEWGVRGLTSNPTIFDLAIKGSDIYDESIARLNDGKRSTDQIFEDLAIEDIAEAADLLRPVYDRTNGEDGFVSIEVSPLLASDTDGTIEEGKRLYTRLDRPNIMIKVPGTAEGIPAVKALLQEGINVNITLLFSVDNYITGAKTYIEALQMRSSKGQPIDHVKSVASFFVSRVDTAVDNRLNEIIEQSGENVETAKSLIGGLGIANSKVAYQRFKEIFGTLEFKKLEDQGATVQRPLWASTGTKNPDFSDVLYIDGLIAPNTVNTMPHKTLDAFVDHGTPKITIDQSIEEAEEMTTTLSAIGVNVDDIIEQLQVEGVKKFSDSFIALNETIENKL